MQRPTITEIRLQNLSLNSPTGKPLLQGVNFVFPDSGVWLLQSPSGAGKSTLLRFLCGLGLSARTSGEYLLNGNSVGEMSFEEFTPWRLQFGLSFDFGGLFSNRTIFQNLSLALEYHKLYDHKEIKRIVEHQLDEFGVGNFAGERPSQVPGAVRKAVCVLRALVHQPQILLLDDPLTGLRREARSALMIHLRPAQELRTKGLTLIATEDPEAFLEIEPEGQIFIQGQNLKIERDGKLLQRPHRRSA